MNAPCRRRPIWAEQARVTNAVEQEIQHETQDETRKDADAAVQVNPYLCSKCGKEYRRGMYFHHKFCKG